MYSEPAQPAPRLILFRVVARNLRDQFQPLFCPSQVSDLKLEREGLNGKLAQIKKRYFAQQQKMRRQQQLALELGVGIEVAQEGATGGFVQAFGTGIDGASAALHTCSNACGRPFCIDNASLLTIISLVCRARK